MSDKNLTADRNIDYSQDLNRAMGLFHATALGFGAVSPVIGLYSTVALGLILGGASWVWVLPIALAGNCLLLYLYTELAVQFPIAGGSYQWTRRLIGPRYAWFAGWLAICGLLASLCTLSYLGAPWILSLLSIEATPLRLVITAAIFNLGCAVTSLAGVNVVKRFLTSGVVAEFAASLIVGIALLLWFRERPISSLWDFSILADAQPTSIGTFLALLAVAGWAFLGFDAVISGAEETQNAARNVPRALWLAMLSVATLVFINAMAVSLAHPNLGNVYDGTDFDPVTTSVVSNFGEWSDKPFVATVVIAFLACGLAANTQVSRIIWSISRDGVLPGSAALRLVHGKQQVPSVAIMATGILACAGLLLAVDDKALGTLVIYGTGGMYLGFTAIALAGLVGRTSGKWTPSGSPGRLRIGLVINVLALAWLIFQTANIMWPRESLAPVGAAWYQLWAGPLVSAGVLILGGLYFVLARPSEKLIEALSLADELAVADQHAAAPKEFARSHEDNSATSTRTRKISAR